MSKYVIEKVRSLRCTPMMGSTSCVTRTFKNASHVFWIKVHTRSTVRTVLGVIILYVFLLEKTAGLRLAHLFVVLYSSCTHVIGVFGCMYVYCPQHRWGLSSFICMYVCLSVQLLDLNPNFRPFAPSCAWLRGQGLVPLSMLSRVRNPSSTPFLRKRLRAHTFGASSYYEYKLFATTVPLGVITTVLASHLFKYRVLQVCVNCELSSLYLSDINN